MDAGGEAAEEHPQGWFADPFGVHDCRWFSQGTPTALVRDGRRESQDPPPEPTWTGHLAPAPPAPSGGGPTDDLPRVGDPGPDVGPGAPSGSPGDSLQLRPAAGGTAPRPTPRRLVGTRWVSLGLSVGWTLLVGAFVASTTSTVTVDGRRTTATELSRHPDGVLLFVALLLVACGVVGLGLWRRIRSDSEARDTVGYLIAGVLLVLGIFSLASIGLTLVILAFGLWVVARPMRRPHPLPGDALG